MQLKSTYVFYLIFLLSFNVTLAQESLVHQLSKNRVTLPNGWKLSPHGSSLPLGDLPLNIVATPNQQYLLATNNGQSVQSLQLIDLKNQQVLDSKELPKSWYGLKVANDNKTVFVSGGNDNVIIVFEIQNGQLIEKDKIALTKEKKVEISPSGIEYDDANGLLYVVTKDNNTLYIIDTKSKNIESTHKLPAEGFTCLFNKSKKLLYISIWGAKQVLPFDVNSKQFLPAISVGDHPNEMVYLTIKRNRSVKYGLIS
jgi:DNA-binding beta-propeller fold protein YncE